MNKDPPTDPKKDLKPPQTPFQPTPSHPNVRVICRIKPLSPQQQGIDMKIDKQNCQISIPQPRQQTTKTFTFNRIFTNQTQGEFVPDVCKRVIHQAQINKKGYLIFSYGVTNSGKTHTILGTQTQPGILPYLVRKLSEHNQVYLSAIQLYNDQFFSLTNKQKLHPKQICGFLDFQHYKISQQLTPSNMDKKFKQYLYNRTQTQTKSNNKSSRSHAIFRIRTGDVVIGVVDLAGSQRSNKINGCIDQTANINKSLLYLGRCIKALNQNPDSQHQIPYRQSKLTKVLIEYFASRVEVLMIANISQSQSCFHQNMKVLDYAVLAKDIHHCTSENLFKKSEIKHHQKSQNKFDIFQTLYKSAIKSIQANKSLKTSHQKPQLHPKLQNNLLKKQTNTTNQKFAKYLKTKQLQLYIQKFASSHETFQYLIQYMNQKQLEDDKKKIQILNTIHYESPFFQQNTTLKLNKQFRDIGVGRNQKSVEIMKKQISDIMKQQLKLLLEEQRMAIMQNKQTQISQYYLPIHQQQRSYNLKQENISLNTPQKQIIHIQDDSYLAKASSQILSSVKTILSKNVQSMKNILPKFMKNKQKYQKFTICNYGSIFQSLFNTNYSINNPRSHQFSFYKDPKPTTINNTNHLIDNQTQTDLFQFYHLYHNDTTTNSSNPNYTNHQLTSKQTQITIRNSQATINSSSPDKAKTTITQLSQNGQPPSKQTKRQPNIMKSTKKNKKTQHKSKSKIKNQSKRVVQIRQLAAKICREQSRTPLKQRLRNHSYHH